MNNEVHDAYKECCIDKRWNVLNDNGSMQKVNVIQEEGKEPEDERIHDKNADAEREDDDGPEHQREERF